MVNLAKDLWGGRLPLKEAVWVYAVAYGLLINLITSLLFLGLLINDVGPILLILAFVLPIPFNLLVVVAVWRSAERYQGPKEWADLARLGTVIWMLVLTAT